MILTSYQIIIPGEKGINHQIAITDGETFVGGVTLNDAESSFPWMSLLFITPTFRRQGHGSCIIKRCIELVPQAKALQLWVHKDNDSAIAFYRSLGFVQISEATDASIGRFGMQLTLKQAKVS